MADVESISAENAALVQASRRDDETAFNRFVKLNTSAVRAVVRRQLRNDADVDDTVQDTFIRAYLHLDSLGDPSRARPWLLAIARNLAIDRRRANQRRRTSPSDELDLDVLDDAAGPGLVAELRELVAATETSIGHLSPRDAVVLDLVARMGFNPIDIAQALQMSAGAAKVALHRARQRLRDALIAEALLERGPSACHRFHDINEAEGLAAAVRHGRRCDDCIDCGRVMLLGYGATGH